jgi:D-alanyl-D-alanine dipeptidase
MPTSTVTLIADPRVLSIPIRECHEPLCDLREIPGVVIDERKRDNADLWLHARMGVAQRLREASAACSAGIRLLLIEAYRPIETQRRYFEAYVARLTSNHPEWDPNTVYANASRYVAPPDIDPPHSTGGAIDVTLADRGGELDLGTPVNASPEDSDGACFTAACGLSQRAQANRDLLVRVMTLAGFANYGTEWWHWSYGDRYWAFSQDRPAAHYGSTAPHAKP